ncbi:hypothetical protein H4R35_006126 [Dimargaris xerosporica]|nr:hypothetical protein H4R35_006126 [Dimargaris xerosporica]
MGQVYLVYLDHGKIYTCNNCQAHLASHTDMISQGFHGRHGPYGRKEDRLLMTGLHTVIDIACNCCQTTLGWRYMKAYEASQKYKEGRYILERARIAKITQCKKLV